MEAQGESPFSCLLHCATLLLSTPISHHSHHYAPGVESTTSTAASACAMPAAARGTKSRCPGASSSVKLAAGVEKWLTATSTVTPLRAGGRKG
jgi:hypothetical protein